MKLGKWFLGIFLLVVIFTILLVRYQNIDKTQIFLQRLTPIEELETYKETSPLIYGGPKKAPHAVLLLHGYLGSPFSFKELCKSLKEAEIPYYAPLLIGFGLSDFHLLEKIDEADWKRDVINSFDILAAFADKVSVIGYSNGGLLAAYLATKRQVNHLILLSPNLVNHPQDSIYKWALLTPGISNVLEWTLPVFSMPNRSQSMQESRESNPIKIPKDVRYPSAPIQSLKTMWRLQDSLDISNMDFGTLSLLYGAKDSFVDVSTLTDYLHQHNILFQKFLYPASDHAILLGKDREQVIKTIVSIIEDKP